MGGFAKWTGSTPSSAFAILRRMFIMKCSRAAAALFLFVFCLPAAAQDWPQWRGPHRDGEVSDGVLPSDWPAQPVSLWRKEVGSGHSSPLVRDGRIYLHTRQAEFETVQCLQLSDGEVLWADRYPAPYRVNPAAISHGAGPKSTPALSDGALVTLGISGILSAYAPDDGRLLWRKQPSDEFSRTAPLYGTAASPLIHQGRLYLPWGGHGRGAILALDPRTGEEFWRWEGDGPGYASPIVAQWQGVTQLVTQTQQMVVGLELKSGRLLWSIPYTTDYIQNCITPLTVQGRLIISGLGNGTRAVIPVLRDQTWSLDEVWANPQVSFYMSTPVAVAGRICGLADRKAGQYVCLDASSGRTLWEGPGRQGENAALLSAGSLLIGLSDGAKLSVFETAAEGMHLLITYDVAESPTWAHPVLLPGRLLVKDRLHLQLWSFEEQGVSRHDARNAK